MKVKDIVELLSKLDQDKQVISVGVIEHGRSISETKESSNLYVVDSPEGVYVIVEGEEDDFQ